MEEELKDDETEKITRGTAHMEARCGDHKLTILPFDTGG